MALLKGAFINLGAGLLGALGLVARRSADAALSRAAVGGLGAVALGGLGTQIVKHVACRARPGLTEGWGVGPTRPDPAASGIHGFFHWPCLAQSRYHGFPSGHATTAFAVAASLLPVAGLRARRAWLGAAAGVGASRVVLNAHFLSDVVGGAVLGWWAADAGRWLAGWYAARRRLPPGPWSRRGGPAA
jgi:undecaprenyl-diphosphatase